MNSLLHSPADILRRVLIAKGLGSDPYPTLAAWPIYQASEPSTPDNAITLYDTTGRDDGRSLIDGERSEHHGIQVRVRGSDPKVAFLKTRSIADNLDQNILNEIVTLEGTSYCVHSVSRTGTILSLGAEAPTSKRYLFIINALVALVRL